MGKKARRKFIEWTYTDESTNKEHEIQVYTLVAQDGKVSFEAEVKTPVRFTDEDENANVLRTRVMLRCAEELKLAWMPYFLLTSSMEGFRDNPFDPNQRNYVNVGLLVERIQVAHLSNGKTIWRGAETKHNRFSRQAKPEWPESGKTERGGMIGIINDTPDTRSAIMSIYRKLATVGGGLRAALDPLHIETAFARLASATEYIHLDDFAYKGSAVYREEDPCPETNAPSTAPTPPSAAAPPA